MNRNFAAVILTVLSSCISSISDNTVLIIDDNFVATDRQLRGAVSQGDSVVGKLWFHDCYCKRFNDRFEINYRYLGGIEGSTLTTVITTDSVEFVLETGAGPQVRPRDYSFKDMRVVLNSREQRIGQLIEGSIALTGTGIDFRGAVLDFKLSGHFECVVRDSIYTDDDFRTEIAKKYPVRNE